MNLNLSQYAWDTGALVSILGILTVFAVLAIIMIVLMIMERIFAKGLHPNKAEVKKKPESNEKATSSQKVASKNDEELAAVIAAAIATDSEIVAIITAAVAASMGVPARNLKIKSFKRVGRAWTEASRQENIYNNL